MLQNKPTQIDFNIDDFKDTPTTPESDSESTPGLADFTKRTEELESNSAEFDKFLDEVEKNPTPENITRLRKANQDLEQNAKDPIKKHALLASRFTKKVNVRIDGQEQKAFKINFEGRSAAEGNVGLGDIMPPNLETVAVYNEKGELITDKAVRRINGKNRIGYYDVDSGSYIPIYHNYYAVPKETRSNSKKDFTLAQRKMKEEIALYNLPQDTRREEEQDDLATAPTIQSPKKVALFGNKQPKTRFKQEPEPNKKFAASRSELSKMGYKAVSKVSPAVTKKATEILHKGNKIGTTTIIEIDGKKYAFRDEVHCHAPTDNVSDRLKRPHHGISVLEYRET